MRLLVSVKNAEEAAMALAGGADIIDAKDPALGALGPVAMETLDGILSTIDGARPVSAAYGEIGANTARVPPGLAFIKIGLSGVMDSGDAKRRLSSVSVPVETDIVLVAYADTGFANGMTPDVVLELAAETGAAGVLLDTAEKQRGSLFDILTPSVVEAWVLRAHEAQLTAAVAGSLRAQDFPRVQATGADIVGVRTAACTRNNRTGTIDEALVRELTHLTVRTAP